MGAVKKVFKGAAKVVSKGIGAITGSNAAKKAAEQQAKQMENQTKQLQEQAKQEQQASIRNIQDTGAQVSAQQSMQESALERDKAKDAAEEKRRKAQEGSGEELDVAVGGTSSESDAENIRRNNVRNSFFGGGNSGSSGLRL